MAARKPAATPKTAKKSTTSESKVVKRPTRGYHKYRNGLLNVTPKGNEKELVKSNQNSPLLRLPPEIRTRIWEHTLGHAIFYAYSEGIGPYAKIRFVPSSDQPSIGVSLLRTCRQIYSEAASMPIRLGTFAYSSDWELRQATKRLKPYQRRQITTLRLEISMHFDPRLANLWNQPSFSSTYPAVKAFQLFVYYVADQEDSVIAKDVEVQIRKVHKAFLEATSMSLTVEIVDDDIPEYRYYGW